jgi:hypothetical protein
VVAKAAQGRRERRTAQSNHRRHASTEPSGVTAMATTVPTFVPEPTPQALRARASRRAVGHSTMQGSHGRNAMPTGLEPGGSTVAPLEASGPARHRRIEGAVRRRSSPCPSPGARRRVDPRSGLAEDQLAAAILRARVVVDAAMAGRSSPKEMTPSRAGLRIVDASGATGDGFVSCGRPSTTTASRQAPMPAVRSERPSRSDLRSIRRRRARRAELATSADAAPLSVACFATNGCRSPAGSVEDGVAFSVAGRF